MERRTLRVVWATSMLLCTSGPAAAVSIATWTGDGDGTRWDDPDNWSPAGVPLNDGETWEVGIASGSVSTAGLPLESAVDGLDLGADAELRVAIGSGLAVAGAASLAGLVESRGLFAADDPGTTLPGGRSRLRAEDGGSIRIAAPSVSSLGLWSPGGALETVLYAGGLGSRVELPSAVSIDAGFDDGSLAVANVQEIVANDEAVVELPAAETLTAPLREGDEIALRLLNGGSVDMWALHTIESAGRGVTRIEIRGGGHEYLFPALVEADQLLIDVRDAFAVVGDVGPLVQRTTEVWASQGSGTVDVIATGGAYTQLVLPSLRHLDAGFDDGSSAHVNVQRVVAGSGSMLGMPDLRQITAPVRAEDRLEIVVEPAARLGLPELEQIDSAGLGATRILASGQLEMGTVMGSSLLEGLYTTTLTVGGDYTVGQGSVFGLGSTDTVTGTIVVGEDLVLATTTPDDVRTGAGVVDFGGLATPDVQRLEVAGRDVGLEIGGLPDENFAIGQLVVGRPFGDPNTLELVDAVDNGNRDGGSEALYLLGLGGQDGLRIRPGSTLALNGLDAYAFDAQAQQLVHLNALFPPGASEVPYDEGSLLLPEPARPGIAAMLALVAARRLHRVRDGGKRCR